MRASVLDLFPRSYDQRRTASAAVHVAHLDMQLIEDGTYFMHEADDEIVACGGWSRRAKLYIGSGDRQDDGRLLHPGTETARVRAMFVGGDWTRRGLGRAILDSCSALRTPRGSDHWFWWRRCPVNLCTRSFGFREVERVPVMMPDGISLEGVAMERSIVPSL
jgi:hypothetical protein